MKIKITKLNNPHQEILKKYCKIELIQNKKSNKFKKFL